MADSIKADDSDVKVGSDSGSDDITASGGDASTSGADLGEVESVDLGEVEPPEVAPPPEPPPLPMGVDQIGQEVSEPGRQAENVDAARSDDEFGRGDLSFQALVGDIQKQYGPPQDNTEPKPDEGDFSAAVATAKNSLNSARSTSISNEEKRAGEYGEFLTTQRTAEDQRQKTFAERENERVNLLKGWNTQLDTMKADAKTRGDTWNSFLTEQQNAAKTRGSDWSTFLTDAQAKATERKNQWGAFMTGQQQAAQQRQQTWQQFMADQQAKADQRQKAYDDWQRSHR